MTRLLILLISLSCLTFAGCKSDPSDQSVFSLLPSKKTGITFINRLKEQVDNNIIISVMTPLESAVLDSIMEDGLFNSVLIQVC